MEIKEAPSTETPTEKIPFATYLKTYSSVEGVRTEWFAGEVATYTLGNGVKHNDILQFLIVVLNIYLGIKAIGKLFIAGIAMYLGDEYAAREPDLLIVLNEHLSRVQPTYLDGIADIVIEIVSPESDARDHGTKLIEYEAAGVPEYWLIDPLRSEAIFYGLGADKRYHPIPRDEQGRLVSQVLPGFALSPATLWQETLPTGRDLIALVDAMKL